MRSNKVENGTGKFDPTSGFTDFVKEGLMQKQEFSQTDLPNTPTLKQQANKGAGKGRKSPIAGLLNLAGGITGNPVVGAFGKLAAGEGSAKDIISAAATVYAGPVAGKVVDTVL